MILILKHIITQHTDIVHLFRQLIQLIQLLHRYTRKTMVEKLKPDELASFREAFDTFDRNSDATISTKVSEIRD